MKYLKESIVAAISDYFQNELTENELSEWAYKCQSRLLDGGLFDLDNLVLYRFISHLTRAGNREQPINDEEKQRIIDILTGKENSSILFQLSIPTKFQDAELVALKEIFSSYASNHNLSVSDFNKVEQFLSRTDSSPKTLNDFLKIQLRNLLSGGYDLYDNQLCFSLESITFTDMDRITETMYLERIVRLLECCAGAPFTVFVLYNEGIPNLSIIT